MKKLEEIIQYHFAAFDDGELVQDFRDKFTTIAKAIESLDFADQLQILKSIKYPSEVEAKVIEEIYKKMNTAQKSDLLDVKLKIKTLFITLSEGAEPEDEEVIDDLQQDIAEIIQNFETQNVPKL